MSASKELTIVQAQADLLMARSAIEQAESAGARLAKYLRGQAGYHLQQAAEKMIKIQIYSAGVPVNNSKIYKHNLGDLISYAQSIGVKLDCPAYVDVHAELISSWEAEGRYDTHMVVKTTTLKKCYDVMEEWYQSLKKSGVR